MSKFKSGAFQEVFNQFYSPLCNYAFRILNDWTWAEDTVQELFIELWKKDSLAEVQHIERFLLRALKFRCIDQLRKSIPAFEGIEHIQLEAPSLLPDQLTDKEIEAWVDFFVAQLPPKTRQIFLLSRTQGLSYREIAETENISVKTVENQMSRALKKLRELIKKSGILLIFSILNQLV